MGSFSIWHLIVLFIPLAIGIAFAKVGKNRNQNPWVWGIVSWLVSAFVIGFLLGLVAAT